MRHELSYYARFGICKGCDHKFENKQLKEGWCDSCRVWLNRDIKWLVAIFVIGGVLIYFGDIL